MLAVRRKVLRNKTAFFIVLIIVIVSIIAFKVYMGKKPQAAVGPTTTVERGNIVSVVAATGTIKPLNIVDVSSKLTGLIKEMKVNENEQVKVGQMLVVLDDTHLQALVAQAQARLTNATANFQRSQQLNSLGAVSEQQLDAASMDYNIAKASYDDAVSQLNDTIIRAPIDGVIIGKPIPAGQAVAPGISSPMVILTVADMSKMQIETQVDESDIGKVKIGQTVTFTVDASPGKNFTGVVSNISSKANVQQNVVYYNVVIDVDSPDGLLKPTMTARVAIGVGESNGALVIPLSAVKSNNGQQYVVVMKHGTTQNVPITTGMNSDDKVEVTSGLTEGDQIVTTQAKAQTPNGGGAGSGGAGMLRGLGR